MRARNEGLHNSEMRTKRPEWSFAADLRVFGGRHVTGRQTTVALLAVLLTVLVVDGATAPSSPLVLECQRETGDQAPLRAGDRGIFPPKRTRYVAPAYPQNTLGHKGTGMWVGEALIDRTGAVTKVWPPRTPSFEPAWPAFNESIAAAIRQWKYAPTMVNGIATPVCMVVTVNIDWR
jgi:hypothetical protein